MIPPGANIDAIDTHLSLSDMEPQRDQRAPIDHFFRTLADAHREQAIGVVLTGTGSDGTAGLRRIRERGGLTIVQSPEEAEHDSMPRSAITAGVADLVLPIDQIVAQVLQVDRAAPPADEAFDKSQPALEADDGTLDEEALQKILALVYAHVGHDFTHYKRATIRRRIRRRMQLHRIRHLDDYLDLLRKRDQEVSLLFEDLLITVTEFFRDPEVFELLETRVIGQLFDDLGPEGRLRVWSIGCATGEEVYSLVMLLMEAESCRDAEPKPFQVFATDLHEPALRMARDGVYPESIEADVSPERLSRFFDRENGSYRIRKQVRDRVVFALHNVLQDPPFSHVRLISCRNMLIYLQRDVQRKLSALFHYALEEDGYLLVGTAEAIDHDLFICEDKKHGLYRRRSVPTHRPLPSSFPLSARQRPTGDQASPAAGWPEGSYGAMHEYVVEQYAPPSILINPEGDVVHCSVRAGRYLNMPGGPPTNDVFHLLPEPLRFELRAAIHSAAQRGGPCRSKPITVTIDGQPRRVAMRVHPIDQPRMKGFVLVIFDELDETADEATQTQDGHAGADVHELETELEQTRKHMQALIEEHEASQERLQAYNEELESTNEELRSTMEELESSKEEMQSMNEELTTLNHENEQKVEELDRLSSDLHNLLTATHIATVFLDRDLCILRFTPSMAKLFNLHDSDRGRSMAELTPRLGYEHLEQDFKHVLERLAPVEREITDDQGNWYAAKLQPYRTTDDRIMGVVITFIDITARKKAEADIREAKELAEKVINTVRYPMLVLNDDLRVRSANESYQRYFGVSPGQVKGSLVYELNEGQWNIPRLREQLEEVLPRDLVVEDFELEHRREDGTRSLNLSARRIDHVQLILLSIEDQTERKQTRQALERSRDELERQVAQRTTQLQQQALRLQALVRELSTAEQRERKRMAAILHDDLQQLLVGMRMQLSVTQRKTRDAATADALGQTLDYLGQAIDTTCTLVRQVAPQALYEEGLSPALQWLSEEMARRHGLKVQVHAQETEPDIGDDIKTVVFESIREMLFNVVKHAAVDQATVTVRRLGEQLDVTVSDEGVGFDVEIKTAQGRKSDHGVFSCCDRIESLGGRWSIDAASGRGTRIHFNLPLIAPRRTGRYVSGKRP